MRIVVWGLQSRLCRECILNNERNEERERMNHLERGRMRTSMTLNNGDYGLMGLFDYINII
jgi:hypothetical protein